MEVDSIEKFTNLFVSTNSSKIIVVKKSFQDFADPSLGRFIDIIGSDPPILVYLTSVS